MSEIKPLRANFDKRGMAYVGTRRVLETVASMACKMEASEFEDLKRTIVGELQALEFNGEHAPIWKQAVEAAKLGGVEQYALQRLGIHPTEKAELDDE